MAIPAGMSAAERAAYEAALELIAETVQRGGTWISFISRPTFRNLTHIPPEIANVQGLVKIDLDLSKVSDLSPISDLTGLEELSLNQTGVIDLSPIRGLTGLRILSLIETGVSDLSAIRSMTNLQYLAITSTDVGDLSHIGKLTRLKSLSIDATRINDLSPIRNLTGLQHLSLNKTGVTDLSPIRSLTELRSLRLIETGVRDLRPIADLKKLGDGGLGGLYYLLTPAVELDENLARLERMSVSSERAQETVLYLKTLPPWPEPLPWLAPDPEPAIPQGQPAPLQVIVQDGAVRAWTPGDGLDDEGHSEARQGWAALRDYLDDLATLRQRLANQLPNLDRALARLESALGSVFDDADAIAIGTHGQRVIRLANATDDSGLTDSDAAELLGFAAALALFLERFPEWRSYRDKANTRPVDPAKLADTLQQIAQIEAELLDRIGIDPEIPRKLRDLRTLSAEDLTDPVAANGLLDSFGNVMSALGDVLVKGAKKLGRTLLWLGKNAATGAATMTGSGLVCAVGDILITKGATLKQIAANFPDKFGWIIILLNAMGP